MVYDAREIANFFLSIAHREKLPLTHLSLQKILFFAHGWHLARFNEALIGQGFEAWQYGPVVRVVYDQLKSFKSKPVDKYLKKLDIGTGEWVDAVCCIDQSKSEFLSALYQYYSKFHASKLVDLTHEKDGPWERTWNKAVDSVIPGMIIRDEDIRVWILREGGRGVNTTH